LNIENIPKELKQRLQWVLWKLDTNKGKIPYTIKGSRASATNPKHWASLNEVIQVLNQGGYDGIGYVFHASDPFTGIDLDDCFIDGELTSEASSTIEALNSYTERSQSGEGIHIIVKGEKPGERNRIKGFEMYDQKRFFVVTGDHLADTPLGIKERQQELNGLYDQLFSSKGSATELEQQDKPVSPSMGDDEIMNIALKAGNGERFKKLYTGDFSSYPSQSEADQAFCNILAFYTQDAEQIDRMYRNSGLMRDKWNRDVYRQDTINRAIRDTKNRYKVTQTSTALDDFKDSIPQTQIFEPYENHSTLAPGLFPLTELGNAERIIHFHKDEIKHSPERGWLLWDGARWAEDSGNQIEVIAAKTLRGLFLEARNASDKDLKNDILKWAKRCESRNIRLNSIADVKPHVNVQNDELDINPYLLNVKNGVIDLETGKLLKHNPDHLMTKLAPVKYEADASAPRWEKFLQEIFITEDGKTDYDVIRFMQKAIGYSLSGSISEEVIFFLTGSGGNGKSKFLEAVKDILGDYARQTNANTFIQKHNESGINNDIARLDKARFVSAVESEQGQQLAESLVKQLTGGDEIAARFLRKEYFEFRPEFKIFFSTNHKPIIRGTDDGIWRRIRLIPFNARFEGSKRDINLSDKLAKESPGILNWALEGFRLWKVEGLAPPASIDQATKSYREDMDLIKPFLDERCIIDVKAREEAINLHRGYTSYCHSVGEIELSNRNFYRLLESRGFERRRGAKNKMFFYGIALDENYETHKDFLGK